MKFSVQVWQSTNEAQEKIIPACSYIQVVALSNRGCWNFRRASDLSFPPHKVFRGKHTKSITTKNALKSQ